MEKVYLVQHEHLINGVEDVKVIGIYSTQIPARRAIERAKSLVGFCDTPDGFYMDEYKLDEDYWTEGYITVE